MYMSSAMEARDWVYEGGSLPLCATRGCYLITKERLFPVLPKDRTYAGVLCSMGWATALRLPWKGERIRAGILLSP